MDEGWRNAFGILMYREIYDGAGAEICDDTPLTCSTYNLWSCQKVCDALVYLLDNIFIRFGTKLYRKNIGIPMGTNCAPLVADFVLFCYERDFLKSLRREN